MKYLLFTVEAHTRFSDSALKVVGVHARGVSEPCQFNIKDVSKGLTAGDEAVTGHAFFIRFTVLRPEHWDCFQSSEFGDQARKNGLDLVELYDLCVDAWVLNSQQMVSFDTSAEDAGCGPASLLIRRPWRSANSATE